MASTPDVSESGRVGSRTITAQIEYDPSDSSMIIVFSGAHAEGLPPWAHELIALSDGVASICIDLRDLQVDSVSRLNDAFENALRGAVQGADVTIILPEEPRPGRGDYYIG